MQQKLQHFLQSVYLAQDDICIFCSTEILGAEALRVPASEHLYVMLIRALMDRVRTCCPMSYSQSHPLASIDSPLKWR